MTYDKRHLALNNMERQAGSTVFNMTAIAENGDRSKPDKLIEIDDLIVLGRLADDAITLDMRILTEEAFPAGTTFDFGFAEYKEGSDVVTGMFPFITGVLLDRPFLTYVIPMPNNGLLNPDGSLYVGDRGSIWGGTEIVARLTAGVMDGKGNVNMINSHSYFGTKSTGGYIK